ncbi:MAG: hypothetical protein JW809_14780 [Pirellulales bacterium]|nr:hypothetical protein [Pirellulales bacterium]
MEDYDPTFFDSLAPLHADNRIGASVARAFEWLWHQTRGKPGYILFTTRDLAYFFRRAQSRADEWIDKLVEAGLIEIIERTPRGVLHVYVYHPNPAAERRRDPPDPQRRLAFADQTQEWDEPARAIPFSAPKTESGSPSIPVSSPKTESDGGKAPEGGAAVGESFPVSSPKTESDGGKAPEGGAAAGRDDPAAHLSSACAGAPARLPITNTKKSILPTSQSLPTQPLPSGHEVGDRESGIGDRGSGLLPPRVARAESRVPSPDSAAPIGAILPAAIGQAIDAATDERGAAARLEARILRAVPELAKRECVDGKWLDGLHAARDAVRLVLDAGVSERDLGAIFNDVRALRAAGNLANPGGFFRYKVDELARRHGIDLRAPPRGT